MPRRKQTTGPIAVDDEREPVAELDGREVESLETLEEVWEGIPGETRCKFYRRDPETHGLKYLGVQAVTPDLDIEEAVRLLGGGGKYVCIFKYPRGVKDRAGKGSKSITLDVDGPPKPLDGSPAASAATIMKGTGEAVSPTLVALMIELATMKGKLEGLSVSAGGVGGGGTVQEQLTMFERMAGVFRSMMPAANDGGGMALAREALGFVNEVKNLVPEPAAEDAGMLLAREGIGLVKTIAQEHPEAVARFVSGNRPLAPRQVTAGAMAPRAVSEHRDPATGAPPPPEPLWVVEARKWIPGLLEEAAQGQDPATVADRALTQVEQQYPKVVYDAIADAAEGEQFVTWAWQRGVAAFPELAPHEAWGKRFLAAVRAAFREDDANPPEMSA